MNDITIEVRTRSKLCGLRTYKDLSAAAARRSAWVLLRTASLRSKRLYRIHAGGTTRGNDCGYQRGRYKQDGGR